MKETLLIFFISLAHLSYSQTTTRRVPINHDSIIESSNKQKTAYIGKSYPNFSTFLNNKEYSNSNLKGKVVFINFWFASCVPCIDELDDLNELYAKFNKNKNFEFISFTFENSDKIEYIKEKYKIKYPIISISDTECRRLNLHNGFPTNIIVDSSGIIKYISLLGQADNFKNYLYPIILKEL